jgi:hypothetical protein
MKFGWYLRDYYRRMRKAGLTKKEARRVTIDYRRNLIRWYPTMHPKSSPSAYVQTELIPRG